jgi:chromosomal replication initiation ATPase DnaA
MTTTDRTDIIAILKAHHDLLGVDRQRCIELITSLNGLYATDEDKSPDIAQVVKAVEKVTGTQLATMQVKHSAREMVEARQIMCYALREHCGLTFKTIGRIIDRDHATVIYGIKQVQNNPRIFEGWQKKVEAILNGMKG